MLCGSEDQVYTVLDELEDSAKSIYPIAAALVDVSYKSGECPNCNGVMQKLFLEESDRLQVRDQLMRMLGDRSGRLEDFDSWLKRREEYVYIVDGANVAYTRQNFDNGRFSFTQVRLGCGREAAYTWYRSGIAVIISSICTAPS
jgi:hypothetical protein